MANFMTKDEVISKAFTRKIQVQRIPDDLIDLMQFKYIRPILQDDLYDAIVADNSSYSALLEIIKPCLAYYCKYELLPEVWVDISPTGVNKTQGRNKTSGNPEEYGTVRQATWEMALMYANKLSKYLDDNTDTYSDYNISANPANKAKIIGGIIFEGNVRDLSGDDDYTQYL